MTERPEITAAYRRGMLRAAEIAGDKGKILMAMADAKRASGFTAIATETRAGEALEIAAAIRAEAGEAVKEQSR